MEPFFMYRMRLWVIWTIVVPVGIVSCAQAPHGIDSSSRQSPSRPMEALSQAVPAVPTFGSATQCDSLPPIPAPPGNAKLLSPQNSQDDTSLIQAAINQLTQGQWLVLQAGNYIISKHLTIPGNDVTIYGVGATIHATNPTDGAIMVFGDNVSIFGLTMTQDVTVRQTTPWAGGIQALDNRNNTRRRIEGLRVQGNTITTSAGGIFINKVNNFTVAENTVYRTLADGIHVTGGSTNGRIIRNTVSQTGDDMIAVVSYAGSRTAEPAAQKYQNWSGIQEQLDRNIFISGNKVSDQYWGRGITVVGGTDVTIKNNTISRTPLGAGIYLTREKSYVTFGDHNILVSHNVISDVQTLSPTFKPPGITITPTRQGAIEVGAQILDDEMSNPTYRDAFSIDGIAIIDNTVKSARFSGIRAGVISGDRTISHLLVQNNSFSEVGSDKILQLNNAVDPSSLVCSNNTLNGSVWPAQCDKGVPAVRANFTVSGAALTCEANGSVHSANAH